MLFVECIVYYSNLNRLQHNTYSVYCGYTFLKLDTTDGFLPTYF